MRIKFEVRAGCDFKMRSHDDEFELRFQAHDDENAEDYSQFFSLVRRGEGGLVDFLIAIFEAAFETFGLTSYTSWGTECIPDPYGDGSAGTMIRYDAMKAPRKRRYGTVTLVAETEWDGPMPFSPSAYHNPARNNSNYAITQVYFAHEFSAPNDYTRESIVEGYSIARTTVAFYEKMARIYEEKTGDKVDLSAA